MQSLGGVDPPTHLMTTNLLNMQGLAGQNLLLNFCEKNS